MKTFAIAALLVVHLNSALSGTPQQPDALQVNASYQCSNGMTVTVTRCAKQNGLENCEFKIEQNGKLAFQSVNLREKVAAGAKSCRAQAASSPSSFPRTMAEQGKSFNPPLKSEPSAFVLSMKNDESLSGPGPIDVNGQIIVGYRKIWMQEYRNGIAVAGGGYWTSGPIYAPKTERCTIQTLAQAPPPAPDKNPLTRGITAAINGVMAVGPPGLRMSGQFIGQGGLALEFADDAVPLDCGAEHVKQPYTVENASSQFQVTIKNGAAPFTLTVQPDGTLLGSGNADVAGRVVTGSTQNALTYAPKNARCAIGTLTPKGRTTAQVSQ
jgi:hypothetical protein